MIYKKLVILWVVLYLIIGSIISFKSIFNGSLSIIIGNIIAFIFIDIPLIMVLIWSWKHANNDK